MRINLHIIRCRNLGKEVLDCLGHLPDQQRFAVFGCPDDMVLQVINGMGACFVGHTKIVAALRAAPLSSPQQAVGHPAGFFVAAYNLGIMINRLLGRPDFAFATLIV